MTTIIEERNVVVVANDINLSIFKPPWLMKMGIFRQEELEGDVLITPVAIQVNTELFRFSVLPNRMQLSLDPSQSNAEKEIKRVIGGIVEKLPHTPYTAVGFNVHYLACPEKTESFESWNRKLFLSVATNKPDGSRNLNARFGSSVSFDALGTKLKIDIKPVTANEQISKLYKSWQSDQELMRINFNFHIDATGPEDPYKHVMEALDLWNEAISLSERIANMISE